MAKLKRDERVCPFCAETIKASAIKCRFCQSEVRPVVEPDAAVAPIPETQRAKEPPAKKSPAKKSPATMVPAAVRAPAEQAPVQESDVVTDVDADRAPLTRRVAPVFKNLTLMLAVLVALSGAGVAALWWSAEKSSSDVAPNGVLVGEAARTEVLVAGADLATRTLSYDYKTFENDMETARARMTKSFAEEYDTTMSQVKDNTTKNKIVLQAVAMSSAIISATEKEAKVLVFLNQTTTAGVGKSAKQQVNQNSLVVTLTRRGGDWDISKLTALG